MKKILFYTDTPQLGGAENQMLLLSKYLPERYKVTLACSSYQKLNPWCQKFMELGIPVIRLKVIHKHDPRHFLYLKKIVREFDLLHVHLWNPASGRYAFFLKERPIVAMEHDPFILQGIKGWMKKNFLPRAKRIIVASRAARDLVAAQLPESIEKICIIPNGIDAEEFTSKIDAAQRNEFRRANFEIAANEKVILCVAELHERKGQKFLIAAMSEILRVIPKTKLVFVGEGPMRRSYEKLARSFGDRISFLGRRKDIAKLIAAADVLVLPSIREAFGLVILEAGASGVPVVSTEVGGIPEIIEQNRTGILVPPESEKALAQAIISILQNPGFAREMASRAKTKVLSDFDARRMAEQTALVYDEILGI